MVKTQNIFGKGDNITGFPSHMIPISQKNKAWHLEYCRSFNKEYTTGGGKTLRYAFADYEEYRLVAARKQPVDQYKPILAKVIRKGKDDLTWKNLDWNILPIIPTLVAVVKNKVLGEQKDILIRGIDPQSMNEERQRRNEMMAHILNQNIINQATQSLGIQPPPSPFEPGTPIPSTQQEIDLHLQMYPKDRYVMELYDQIDRVKSINNWRQIWDEVVEDLVEVGIAGTKAYLDIDGMIRVRRVIPERVITNHCVHKDFSDLTRVGEYIEMSITELRSSVPPGTFSEDDYVKIVRQSTGKIYDASNPDALSRTNFRYPYDHEKIVILDAEWFSDDAMAYVEKYNQAGNMILDKQDDPYWLSKVQWQDEKGEKFVGVSDKQYVEFSQKQGKKRRVIRTSIENLYGAKWIVGTDYVFDWGLKSNMIRSLNRLGSVRSNYNFFTFWDSYMRRAAPIAHQIQINWLQHQHQVAKSRPSGLKINKRALTSITVGGKGGVELNELDIIEMYAQTGNFIYKGEDAAGRPYPFDPIQELKGGMNEAAFQHLQMIIQYIDMLRNIFGLNEVTDSSTPNPKLGKAVAQMLQQSTNTALGDVYYAYSKLYEETVRSVALMVPDAELIKSSVKDEGLGESSGQFFRMNNDMTFREHAISIEDGPSNELRQVLQKYVEQAIVAKEIRPEDAFLVEKEPNLQRAYYMLAMKRRQKMEEDAAINQQNMAAQAQGNADVAIQTKQAEAEIEQMRAQAEIEKAYQLHPLDLEKIAAQAVASEIIQKIKSETTLTEKEMDIMASWRELVETGNQKMKQIKATPKQSPQRKTA